MATISSFRTALEMPRSHFSALAQLVRLDDGVARSTYFAETRVECGGCNMMIYMPLASVSLRRVERFIPLKRNLASAVVPRLTILREEMRWLDAMGREQMCDILCEPLPDGFPLADAVATIADEEEATQLIEALDELQAELLHAGVSHNNIREENIFIDKDYHLHLVRWYYATDGVGGDDEAFAALRQKMPKDARMIAVLEPRSNTMKMGTMKAQLPESLTGANHVVCYAAPTLSWDVAEAMLPLGEKVDVLHSIEETVNVAVNHARSGDYILVMSNGGFGGIHGKLLDALKGRA